MVDDHGQVALALAVADLVDADPAQMVERIETSALLGGDPGQDPADRQPGDPHQLRDRPLRALAGKPGDLVLEAAREARVVARPRHRRDHHTMPLAAHPRRLRLQEADRGAQIERTPPPPALTRVVAGAASATEPAAAPLAPARARRDNQRVPVEPDVLDHRLLDAQQPSPYPHPAHAVSLLSRSDRRTAGNVERERRAPSRRR
ncbi:MAG: hypothetical protein C4345_06085 [Chloroflexota bacterium]